MPELKIHPTAARFPQLSDEETDGLAQDIKVNGLHQPIVLTADGKTLVDGINRRRACEKAGVKPKVRNLAESYTEADIIHFIMGANLRRRDLNPGARLRSRSRSCREGTATRRRWRYQIIESKSEIEGSLRPAWAQAIRPSP